VIALFSVMVPFSAAVVVYEARAADHASLVPWLLVLGPIVGLLITWLGGPTEGAVNTPRAQATHFTLFGVMMVSVPLLIVLDGPTVLVFMTEAYCVGFGILLIAVLALWQQRRMVDSNT
jgi:hypothetical protein